MKKKQRIVTVTMNPAIDFTCSVPDFKAGHVNRVVGHRMDPAGKGVNIARLLRLFDLPVTATGFLGRDNAHVFETMFRDQGIDDAFVRVPGETRIGVKVVDPENRSTTDINFPGVAPDAEHLEQLMECVERLAGDAFVVAIGGSLPQGIPPDVVGRMVSLVRKQGARAVVDTSGEALKHAIDAIPWLIKPNDDELAQYLGRTLDQTDELLAEARRLTEAGIATVVISLGARGALFVEKGQSMISRPPTVDVVSTVGAGDAMVAALVGGMVLGLPLARRVRMATAISAATVAVSSPCLKELDVAKALEARVEIEDLNA